MNEAKYYLRIQYENISEIRPESLRIPRVTENRTALKRMPYFIWGKFDSRVYMEIRIYWWEIYEVRDRRRYTRRARTHLFYSILPVSGYNVPRYRMRDPHCSHPFLHKDGEHESYFNGAREMSHLDDLRYVRCWDSLLLTQGISKICGSIKLLSMQLVSPTLSRLCDLLSLHWSSQCYYVLYWWKNESPSVSPVYIFKPQNSIARPNKWLPANIYVYIWCRLISLW